MYDYVSNFWNLLEISFFHYYIKLLKLMKQYLHRYPQYLDVTLLRITYRKSYKEVPAHESSIFTYLLKAFDSL